jgi:hypothetical protein
MVERLGADHSPRLWFAVNPIFRKEEKGGQFAEDPDIQMHKKAIKEPGHDNLADHPGLIVK